jgi:hypothetical protein
LAFLRLRFPLSATFTSPLRLCVRSD